MPKPPLDPGVSEFVRALARDLARRDFKEEARLPDRKPLDPELREFVKALAEQHADEEWERRSKKPAIHNEGSPPHTQKDPPK